MRKPILLLLIMLFSYLGFVIYANRALYFSRFDEPYWRDRYEHSQWKLPLSIRTIGDDGLYLYEGFRLIHGGDPTTINAEMPPLGKYLIGVSLLMFTNGHWYGFFTTIALLIATYFLANFLTKKPIVALSITLLLATDPLITNQYALTMMDAPQAALLCIWLLLLLRKRPFLTGLALGLFSATKIGLVSPVFALVSMIFLPKRSGPFALFFVGTIAGYLLPYAAYFFHGHTLIEWLKLQKWMVSFYLKSTVSPTWGSALTALLFGRYQNIFSRAWETAPQWTPVWSILLLLGLGGAFRLRRTLAFSLLFLILAFYSAVPFWPRYLVIVLPFLYLAGSYAFINIPSRTSLSLFIIAILMNLITSYPTLFPGPQSTINQVVYNLKNAFFSDLYEDITIQSKRGMTRDEFRRFGLKAMMDGQIERIEINRKSPQTFAATFTYYTRELGSFSQDITVLFVLEDNRWRIPWDWSYLIPGLTIASHMETTVIPAKRGSILASDKTLLANDQKSYLVTIIPNTIRQSEEPELLSLLEQIFDQKIPSRHFHQRIHGNTLGDVPVLVGVVPKKLSANEYDKLRSFQGVTLIPHTGRFKGKSDIVTIGGVANSQFFECCSYLYSTTTYDGVSGVEQAKNDLLKGQNGGSLVLKDDNENILQTFIAREKIDGQDVEP